MIDRGPFTIQKPQCLEIGKILSVAYLPLFHKVVLSKKSLWHCSLKIRRSMNFKCIRNVVQQVLKFQDCEKVGGRVYCLAKYFAISWLWNLSTTSFYTVQNRWRTNFEALKLWNILVRCQIYEFPSCTTPVYLFLVAVPQVRFLAQLCPNPYLWQKWSVP